MNDTNYLETFPDLFELISGIKQYPTYIIVYVIVYGVAAIIGAFGHATIIAVTCCSKKLRNIRNAFVVSLSTADLIVSIVVMPASIIGVLYGRKWYEDKSMLCYFTSIVCAPSCIASMYSIAFIAISRYYFVAQYPLYVVYFTAKKIALYIAAIWLFSFTVHLPNHLGWGSVHYTFILRYCSLDADKYSYAMFYAGALSSAIGISFVFYLKIFLVVRKSTLPKMMITGGKKKPDKPEATFESYQKHREKRDKSKISSLSDEIKMLKSTFKIFVLFVVCWSPACVLLMISLGDKIPVWAYLYSAMLSHLNSTLNFSVYFVSNDLFRKAIK